MFGVKASKCLQSIKKNSWFKGGGTARWAGNRIAIARALKMPLPLPYSKEVSMKNIKKTLSFVLLLVFAFSMLVFGCGDKYANLKVTTDVPEEGITLYIGKDTENDVLSKATFVATVSGAGEDISTNLKYHLSKDIVDVTYINLGVETEFTVSATNYGSTTMTILTEEGRKSTEVIINVVKEIQDLNLYSSYKPYVFAGDSSYIDTAQAIDFVPADTSQRSVTYSMVGSYDGVTIQPNGKNYCNRRCSKRKILCYSNFYR